MSASDTHQEIAMRETFGESLVDLASEFPRMVVLDADVSSSTKTIYFAREHPERFYNIGVAEANLVDVAAGFSTCGFVPVVSTFALFLATKSTDQLRNVVCYNGLSMVVAGGYAGLSDSYDGASHQSVSDLAIMRALPGMRVYVPGDPAAVPGVVKAALSCGGPAFVRLSRNPTPVISTRQEWLQLGAIDRVRILRSGSDCTIVACGVPVYIALEAAESAAARGIDLEVVQVTSLKPLDATGLVESARKTGRVVTVEEHSVIGGLGGAVSEVLAEECPVPIRRVGVKDTYTESGPYPDLLEKYGISAGAILAEVDRLLQRE